MPSRPNSFDSARRATATAPRASSTATRRRSVVVAECRQHRLGAYVRTAPRGAAAGILYGVDCRPEAVRDVQPVNPLLEERVAAGHRLVVPPVAGCLELAHQRREVGQDQLADRAVRQQPPQADRQRLVVIVLAHQHDPARTVARLADPLVVGQPRECRLLHQYMLPGGSARRSGRDETAAAPPPRRRRRPDRRWRRDSRGSSGLPVPHPVRLRPGPVAAGVARAMSSPSRRRCPLWTPVMKPQPRNATWTVVGTAPLSGTRQSGRRDGAPPGPGMDGRHQRSVQVQTPVLPGGHPVAPA